MYICIFDYSSPLKSGNLVKFTLKHGHGLNLNSQYHVCWWPSDDPSHQLIMRLTLFICDIPSPTTHTLSSVLTMMFVLWGRITLWSAGTIGIPGVDWHLLRVITSHASACIDREISQAWNVTQQSVTQPYIRGQAYWNICPFIIFFISTFAKEKLDCHWIIQITKSHTP